MADMIVSGINAVENVEKIYGSQAVQRNRALKEQSSVKNIGNSAASDGKNAVSFKECMEKAVQKETSVFKEGEDVVMSRPPVYRTGYRVDMNKSREEMTMDEYKQYICNKVSSLPISDSMRACGSGVLIFKEEAFESMKNNPAYENEVMGMLGEAFSAQLSSYEPNIEYQVIGKTSGECYGTSIPVKTYGWMQGLSSRLASSLLASSGLSGLDLMSSSPSNLALLSSNLSGLGLASSGLLSSGFSGLGLLSSGLFSPGLSAIGIGLGNRGSAQGTVYGANRTNMMNAYRNTAINRNNYNNMRSIERNRKFVLEA